MPASPRTRMRPIGPASPICTSRRAAHLLGRRQVGQIGTMAFARVHDRQSVPARQAASSAWFGSIVRRSCETSLPSISPKPPGSRKSRCMSMISSAQRARVELERIRLCLDRRHRLVPFRRPGRPAPAALQRNAQTVPSTPAPSPHSAFAHTNARFGSADERMVVHARPSNGARRTIRRRVPSKLG